MKNDEIKVSVIVPIYNVDKYLEKCIDSIINQTYSNIEIILVDDGSPDNSGIVCDKYAEKDERIKVIHKKNAGVSAARNSGIDIATGQYICFIDGDDYVSNDYVEYLLNLALDNNVDISVSAQMFSNFNQKQFKNEKIEIWSGEKATEGILCYRLPIGANAKLFKRDFLGESIRFLPNLVVGEGFNFNTTAFQNANNVAIGYKKVYFYRKNNPTSVTTKFSKEKWENGLYALENIKENFIINSEKINKAWKYANWRTHSDAYDLMVIAKATKKYPDMYKKCKKNMRKGFFYSIITPTSFKDKLRAMVMMIFPKLIPLAMILRRKKYNVKV